MSTPSTQLEPPPTPVANASPSAVYAYGGALMFVEFIAELKRPMDFFKAMICAQSFILFLYLF